MQVSIQIVEAKLNLNEKFKKYICIDDEESICLLTLPGLFQISFSKPLPDDVKINKITDAIKWIV